jgi:hypothetical protein
MGRSLALALTALCLCACSQGGGLPFVGGGVAPPERKAGLWRQTLSSDRLPAPVVTLMCLDETSDKRVPVLGRRFRRGACDKYTITRRPDGAYLSDTACETGGGAKITTHTVATGDFTSSYTVVSQRTVQGSDDPNRDGQFKTTVTAAYKGPCPANLQPGQMQYPDGAIANIGERRGYGGGAEGAPSGGDSQAAPADAGQSQPQ